MRNRSRAFILLGIAVLAMFQGGPGHQGRQTVHAQDVANTATHPIVLGYERFHAGEKSAAAGQLLLGELGCTSCHKAEAESPIQRKQAPILDGVGSRLRVSFLKEFLANPHGAKPGTAMPNVIESLPPAERADAVNALTHFLASTGSLKEVRPQPRLVATGQQLFHSVGCAACHGPQTGKLKEKASVLPLGDVGKKYSIASLTSFLLDPHKVRPSGRMPSLNLKPQEALDIATYLLADLKVAGATGNRLNYTYYELSGEPSNLPDFSKLKATATGVADEFDVGLARRKNNVALKFDGFLRIENEGNYTFNVASDDGSRLWIDGKVVVDNDGIHPTLLKSGSLKLIKGVYALSLGVFQAGGEFVLSADVQGPSFGPVPLAELVYPSRAAAENPPKKEAGETLFIPDAALAKKGRDHFAAVGCASCHNLTVGKETIASKLEAPLLSTLKSGRGCLAEKSDKAPRFRLNETQRESLGMVLGEKPLTPRTAKEQVDFTFTAFNCFACHERGGKGGIETGLNDFFKGTQPEMGDEGRAPPHLNGVGAKLKPAYLKKILAEGIQDRPYMLTRMPKFGGGNVGALQQAVEELDEKTIEPWSAPKLAVADKKAKSEGRHMVGNQAFGCIKCHNFKEHKSGGVQGMNMALLTERLRHDWFARYLLDPNKFRPGTRMPAIWPFGVSQLPKVLNGDTNQQIEAVWLYLSDGNKAAVPFGMGRQPILLEPTTEAIIYRNFIEGAGARAIGVGYPERVNLAFDANDLRYAMLWQNQFIDASLHWTDRGTGFEGPLGDGVLHLASGPSFAVLDKKNQQWPGKVDKEKGYKFRGYTLDDKQRPTFQYSLGEVRVEDFMLPVEGKEGASFKRILTITSNGDPVNLFYRAIAGPKIVHSGKGWYQVGDLRMRVDGSVEAQLRTVGNQMELLIPITEKKCEIIQEYHW